MMNCRRKMRIRRIAGSWRARKNAKRQYNKMFQHRHQITIWNDQQMLNKIFNDIIFNKQLIYILANSKIMNILIKLADKGEESINNKRIIKVRCKFNKRIFIYNFQLDNELEEYKCYRRLYKPDSQIEFEMCCNFIMYQIYKLKNEEEITIEKFRENGFLVASPWHGDVEKAPILFLGPNPGITMRCLFPRLHVDKNKKIKVTLAGESYGDTTWKYDGKCYHNRFNIKQDKYCDDKSSLINRLINSKNYVTLHDFFKDRIRPTKRTGSLDVLIPNKNNNNIQPDHDQKYWRGIVTSTDILLNAAGNYDGPCTEKILSSEIIPFGSMDSFGLEKNYLDLCWEKYTKFLLENCGAKIIILVGGVAATWFWRKIYAQRSKEQKQYRNKNGEPKQNEFIKSIQNQNETVMREFVSSCGRRKECYIAYIDHPSRGLTEKSKETLRKLGKIDEVREILKD